MSSKPETGDHARSPEDTDPLQMTFFEEEPHDRP
jgi:hypothetical protein